MLYYISFENGLQTGFHPVQLKVELFAHVQYAVIQSLTIRDIVVDPPGKPGVIHVDFDLTAGLFGKKLMRVAVSEDFVVPAADGRIHRIDATISR